MCGCKKVRQYKCVCYYGLVAVKCSYFAKCSNGQGHVQRASREEVPETLTSSVAVTIVQHGRRGVMCAP